MQENIWHVVGYTTMTVPNMVVLDHISPVKYATEQFHIQMKAQHHSDKHVDKKNMATLRYLSQDKGVAIVRLYHHYQ